MCARIYALEYDSTHLCLDCRNIPFSWQGMSFFSSYQGLLKSVILRYKFSAELGLGSALGTMLAEAAVFQPYEHLDMIIPVPLHPARLRQRGFNQSLELARVMGRKIGLEVQPHALIKTRNTPPQTSMKRKLRLKSLRRAFAANNSLVNGRKVLLIDDIMTTGSTMEECTRELFRAGASEVRIVFLARTV